jgi:hypothetical protein
VAASVAIAGVIETIEYADDARIIAAVSGHYEFVTSPWTPKTRTRSR